MELSRNEGRQAGKWVKKDDDGEECRNFPGNLLADYNNITFDLPLTFVFRSVPFPSSKPRHLFHPCLLLCLVINWHGCYVTMSHRRSVGRLWSPFIYNIPTPSHSLWLICFIYLWRLPISNTYPIFVVFWPGRKSKVGLMTCVGRGWFSYSGLCA